MGHKLFLRMFSFCLFLTHNLAMAQEKEVNESISGAWKLSVDVQVSEMRRNRAAKMSSMDEVRQDGLRNSLDSRMYIFLPDGTFEAYWVMGGNSQEVRGKWTMGDGPLLRIEIEGNEAREYTLHWEKGLPVLVPNWKTESLLQNLYLQRLRP